jgi:hypothetical protein
LDLVVFVANLFLMRILTGLFIDLFRHVSAGEPLAKVALGLTAVAMYALSPAAAILKRWHFQQRWKERNQSYETEFDGAYGCIFHPIFYLSLNLVLMCAIVAVAGDFMFGKRLMEDGNIFLPLIFGGMAVTIFQTYLVYRYFSPPRRTLHPGFLQHPASERLGDLCIFVNMLLYQVAWNLLTDSRLSPPSGAGELIGRVGFLTFSALLVYFPPRMLYLAEDLHRRSTWMTMLLANSPTIARVVLGL